jgi:hypothetical protein
MNDREKTEESKKLFEILAKMLDVRNKHVLESNPDEHNYFGKLKILDHAMWQAHSRWETLLKNE